ncbi:unnamed protein product [Prorocentrum cordatum]|uniref:Galectin n=1 Tax=Prorocentrum cordatum TaxID=2364126 RepID=A0ABN9W561_9DINO|nr:unnamed protein product [Polarella glacialis]
MESVPSDVLTVLDPRDPVGSEGAQMRPSPALASAGGAVAAAEGARPPRSPPTALARPLQQVPLREARGAGAPAGAQTCNVPWLPPAQHAAAAERFRFDPQGCSAMLDVSAPNCLRCVANATRSSQGVCFLDPPIAQGQVVEVRFRFDNKPGRMRYFLGVARQRFASDACDIDLRKAGWSIENLYASPHSEGSACTLKAAPIFHTGSVVTLAVDLRDSQKPEVRFSVDTTGVCLSARLPTRGLHSVIPWISLYNRGAQVTLLDTALKVSSPHVSHP